MTTYTVPTWTRYPGTFGGAIDATLEDGWTIYGYSAYMDARDRLFMLPGYDGSQGGVPWTDHWCQPWVQSDWTPDRQSNVWNYYGLSGEWKFTGTTTAGQATITVDPATAAITWTENYVDPIDPDATQYTIPHGKSLDAWPAAWEAGLYYTLGTIVFDGGKQWISARSAILPSSSSDRPGTVGGAVIWFEHTDGWVGRAITGPDAVAGGTNSSLIITNTASPAFPADETVAVIGDRTSETTFTITRADNGDPFLAAEDGTFVFTLAKLQRRDITDAFNYWFTHTHDGDADSYDYRDTTTPFCTPLSATWPATNTVQLQPDERYVFDYGFGFGSTSPDQGPTGCSLIDGSVMAVNWPDVGDFYSTAMILDLNGSALEQVENTPNQRNEVTIAGVLHRGSAVMTNCTIPEPTDNDPSSSVPELLDPAVQFNAHLDPFKAGTNTGWAFYGHIAIGSDTFTSCVPYYDGNTYGGKKRPYRPITADWVGHRFKSTYFGTSAAYAVISAVTAQLDGSINITVNRVAVAAGTGNVVLGLDDNFAWNKAPYITAIDNPSPGTGRNVTLSATSPWSWGLYGSELGKIAHKFAVEQPRRKNGTHLFNFVNSSFIQVMNGEVQMGSGGKSGTFTPHESWTMFSIHGCFAITIGDPTGQTLLTVRNSWSDWFDFAGLPQYITISHVYAKESGRQGLTLEGVSNLVVEHSTFINPGRWMMDMEDGVCYRASFGKCSAGSHATDVANALQANGSCAFAGGFGLFHLRTPDNDINGLPSPCWIEGCSTTDDPYVLNVSTIRSGQNLPKTSIDATDPTAPAWPVNLRDLANYGPTQTSAYGAITNADIGTIVMQPPGVDLGVPEWNYITAVSGASIVLAKPVTGTFSGERLVLGDHANFRGLHLDSIQADKLEIWFDGVNDNTNVFWFLGTVNQSALAQYTSGGVPNGSIAPRQAILPTYFPPRPDGSAQPGMGDTLSALYCAYKNQYGSGHKMASIAAVYNSSGTWIGMKMSKPAASSTFYGPQWFYAAYTAEKGWFSDIVVENSIGLYSWNGGHYSSGAHGQKAIQLPHHTGDVKIVGNSESAQSGESVVGTNQPNLDMPLGPPWSVESSPGADDWTNITGPKNSAATRLVAPNSPDSSRWIVGGNHWSGADDNNFTTVPTHDWIHSLTMDSTPGITLLNAGGTPGGTPRHYSIDGGHELTVLVQALDYTTSPTVYHNMSGDFVLVIGGVDAMTATIDSSNLGTFVFPDTYFAQGTYTFTARYDGGVAGGYSFPPTVFNYTNFAGVDYSTVVLTVGAAPIPTPTTTTLTLSTATAAPDEGVVVTAQVAGTDPDHLPTGQVTLYDYGTEIGKLVPLPLTGTYEISRTFLVGGHSITAAYAGDAHNLPSDALPQALTVSAPDPGYITVGVVKT